MAERIKITIDDSELVRLIEATKDQKPIRIVADGVEYGIYQEMGPSETGTRRWRFQPFMRPAVEAIRQTFLKGWESIDNWVQAEQFVEQVARGVERGAKMRAPVDTGALRSSIHVLQGEMFEAEFTPERLLKDYERERL